MKIKQIQNYFSHIVPNISEQNSADMIQPIFDLLDEIKAESIEELPSMKRQITDSFHMVKELMLMKYGK